MHAAAVVSDPALSPAAKVFLVRFLEHYGWKQPMAIRVKDLARTLKMTDKAVTDSTEALVRNGYLRGHSVSQYKTGRPRKKYHGTPHLGDRLRAASEYWRSPHRLLVNELFLFDNEEGLGPPLSNSSRVVLAVLLCHADPCGAVRSLGLSDLAKRTRISRDAVKARISELTSTGHILGSSFGGTHARLFGITKGTHVLHLWRTPELEYFNLSYDEIDYAPIIENAARELIGYIGGRYTLQHKRRRISSEYVVNDLLDRHFGTVQKADTFPLIAHYCLRHNGGQSKLVLQLKLEEYACDILSRFWDALDDSALSIDDVLYERIRSESALSIPNARSIHAPSDDHRNALAMFLYGVSWKIAETSKFFARNEVGSRPFRPSSCALIPSVRGKPRRLVCLR